MRTSIACYALLAILSVWLFLPVQSHAQDQYVYWVADDGRSIQRASIADRNVEDVMTTATRFFFYDLVINATDQEFYWTGGIGTIGRANLDGTAADTLADASCGNSGVTGIDFDLSEKKIYWGRHTDCANHLQRMAMGGGEVETLPFNRFHYFVPHDISLDTRNDHIYWVNVAASGPYVDATILRADFEGTQEDIEEVTTIPASNLTLDLSAGKIYWTHFQGSIYRSNLNGTEAEVIFTSSEAPFGIALDREAGKIYWSEPNSGKIRRANLDGTDPEDVVIGLTKPERIALSFGQDTSVDVGSAEDVPTHYQLKQNYPNPFNPATTIAFTLPQAADMRLVVYDLLGREVVVLVEGTWPAGSHTATFEAGPLPSGVYLYQLEAGDFIQTRHMLLLK